LWSCAKRNKGKGGEVEPNAFKDSAGNLWTFRITAKHALDMKNNMGFDVRDIENPEKLSSLVGGSLEILDLIAFSLAGQLKERDMDANDLFENMSGDEVAEACWAFIHGCIFFFPSHTRKAMTAWASRVQTIQNRSGSMIEERILSPEMDEMLDNLMGKR
jgi:hypothetical protein